MASLSSRTQSQYHGQANYGPNWSMQTINTRQSVMMFDDSISNGVMSTKINPCAGSSPPAPGFIADHHHVSSMSYSNAADDHYPLSSTSLSAPKHATINHFANPCMVQPEVPMLSAEEYYGLRPAKELLENQYSPDSAANASLSQHYSSKTDSSSDNSSPATAHPRSFATDSYDQFHASGHCIDDLIVPRSPNSNYNGYWQGLLHSHLGNSTDVQAYIGMLSNMQDNGQDMLQGGLPMNNTYDGKLSGASSSYIGRYCDVAAASMGSAPLSTSSAQFPTLYDHSAIIPALSNAVMSNVDAMVLMQMLKGEEENSICSSALQSLQHEKISACKAACGSSTFCTTQITATATEDEEGTNNRNTRTGACADQGLRAGEGLMAQRCANFAGAGPGDTNYNVDANEIKAADHANKRPSCAISNKNNSRANARKRARSSAASGDHNAATDQQQYLQSILEGVDHQIFNPPPGVVHVRARRGQATDSHSLAERVRREKISQRMKLLQELVPGCDKVLGKAMMLDEIINYVKSLQRQVEFLSMKLATASGNNCCLDDDDQPHSIVTICKPIREAALIKGGSTSSPFNSICS